MEQITAVAVQNQGGQVSVPMPSEDEIRRYIAPNATEQEFFLFMNICRAYGLNPVKREAHFIKYGNAPGQTVVGYEIYIKRAERTGMLDGWAVELGKDQLGDKATITIHRKDRAHPFVWTVYRDEFDSGKANWQKMPKFMLRKVAISQGFRLAFPVELGGMPYIPEEITGGRSEELPSGDGHDASSQSQATATQPDERKYITPKQLGMLRGKGKDMGFKEADLLDAARIVSGDHSLESIEQLYMDEASKLIKGISDGSIKPMPAKEQMGETPF